MHSAQSENKLHMNHISIRWTRNMWCIIGFTSIRVSVTMPCVNTINCATQRPNDIITLALVKARRKRHSTHITKQEKMQEHFYVNATLSSNQIKIGLIAIISIVTKTWINGSLKSKQENLWLRRLMWRLILSQPIHESPFTAKYRRFADVKLCTVKSSVDRNTFTNTEGKTLSYEKYIRDIFILREVVSFILIHSL